MLPLPLRFCVVGIALILLAFGFVRAIDLPTGDEVYSDGYDYTSDMFVEFVFVTLFGAGIFVIFRGLRLALAKDAPSYALPRIFPEMQLQNVIPWRGKSSFPSIIMTMLNAFSVSWICVLMTLLIIFQMFGPWPSKGLSVDWKRPLPAVTDANPWGRTMSVYVGYPSRVYLNGQAVSWDEFAARLREELSHRAEWTVYVEADPRTAFMDTVHAIDMIQGLGGKVVWITPKMREEWKKEKVPPSP